jgi:PTS system mannose-specific IIA component
LIKLARVRAENNMDQALNFAQESGRKYINIASRLLQGQ